MQCLVGFTSLCDRQRIAAFLRRVVRRGFCHPDLSSIDKLASDMGDKLFHCITSDNHYVRLAPTNSFHLSILTMHTQLLTQTTKTRTLSHMQIPADELNFIDYRMLYKDVH